MPSQMPNKEYSEPEFAKLKDQAKPPYYHSKIDHKITPETRELLENYSHVPPEHQSEHVHKIRDQAWDIRAYPCTGLGAWLTPQLRRLPVYPEVLKKVQDGAILVDIGTFIGYDLRRLAYDGAPSNNLYGVDIASHFEVGYNFFRDREHFKGRFIEADFLSNSTPELQKLKGQADIILVSQVLHLWNWDGQLKAAKCLSSFSKPGSMVIGNQLGNPNPQEVTLNLNLPHGLWHHNPNTFANLWEQVGAETGTKWETQAWLRSFEEMGWDAQDAEWLEPGVSLMEFVVRRLS